MHLLMSGVEKLVKPHICLSDLDPPDIQALQGGGFQMLPQRDSAGRAIGVGVPFFNRSNSVKSNVSFVGIALSHYFNHSFFF